MAWYRAGTIAVTNGSPTVTGAGTAFVANVRIGHGLVAPDGKTYEIAAVVSDTQLTLASTYLGGSGAGQAYSIIPTQSFMGDLATQASNLLNSFSTVRDGVGAGLHPDGSAAVPAIRFAADQDTGIARGGPNAIAVILGGLVKLTFNSNGDMVQSPGGSFFSGGPIIARPMGDGEGGQIDLQTPDGTATAYSFDIDNSGNARLFTIRNNQSLVIGQILGTGGNVKIHADNTEIARFDVSGLRLFKPLKFEAAYSAGSPIDTSAGAITLAAGATFDFPNFSGMIIVNNHSAGGQIGIYLCGGSVVTPFTAGGGMTGITVTYVTGIGGYRLTNTGASPATFGLASIRTRTTA